MGISIIWVILFHAGYIPYINIITSIGYGGVDFFFFLSGFGLFFSLQKDKNKILFYKKRLKRIYPTYIIIVLITMILLGIFSLKNFIINISTIGFWTGMGSFEWYIPSLFMFYLIFPYMYKLLIKNHIYFIIISLIITVVLVSLRVIFSLPNSWMLFITRIPIFSIGAVFGKLTFEKIEFKRIKLHHFLFIGISAIIMLLIFKKYFPNYLWNLGLYWYPFILITPTFCVIIAIFLEKLSSNNLNSFLRFFGLISLELYLLHIKIFEKSQNIADYFNVPRALILIISISIIIPIAFYLSKLIKYISNKTQPNLQHRVNLIASFSPTYKSRNGLS